MPSKTVGDRTNNGNPNKIKLRQTCDACQAIKTRCSRDKPSCARCQAYKMPCNYGVSRRIGRPRRLAPPPSPVSPSSQARRTDEQPPVTTQAGVEIGGISQPESQFFPVDWNGVDNNRMLTDSGEALSNSSEKALEHQKSRNDSLVTTRVGETPITSMAPASSAPPSGLNEQDLFDSFFQSTDFSSLPSSSLPTSGAAHLSTAVSDAPLGQHTSEIKVSANNTVPRTLDDSEMDPQSNSLHALGQQIEHTQFAFSPSHRELDTSGPFGWEFSGDAVPPLRESACRCHESALSITLSIRQGHGFPNSGVMDLALDVEAQLRESVPLAVQCHVCKSRRVEILTLFSNAIAEVVDLIQQLCHAEFSINSDSPTSQPPRTSSIMDGFEWLQAKPNRHCISNSHQLIGAMAPDRDMPTTHATTTSNGGVGRRPDTSNGTTRSLEHPSSPKTNTSDHSQTTTELGSWRMLIGRHLIVGDEKKFILIHLLRRRLCTLSNVLESLIRAMQDLRTALRRVDSFMLPFEDDVLTRADAGANATAAEIGTRKSMKTAAKLYDIIDQLEVIHI